MRSFIVTGRAHFYRPVVELWWDSAFLACAGRVPSAITRSSFSSTSSTASCCCISPRVYLDAATWPSLRHSPGRSCRRTVEAVLWICAVTTAFAAMWYLAALHFALTAAQRQESRLGIVGERRLRRRGVVFTRGNRHAVRNNPARDLGLAGYA